MMRGPNKVDNSQMRNLWDKSTQDQKDGITPKERLKAGSLIGPIIGLLVIIGIVIAAIFI